MPRMDSTQARCENCGWAGDIGSLGRDLWETPDLNERLSPGETVPAGECPKCGTLAHLTEDIQDEPAPDVATELRAIRNAQRQIIEDLHRLGKKMDSLGESQRRNGSMLESIAREQGNAFAQEIYNSAKARLRQGG